jgi:hypothetical protein
MPTRIMLAVLLTSLASGCGLVAAGAGGVRGSGVIKEETRTVPEFTGVEIGQAIRAEVTVGPEASVRISGDENLLPMVKTEVKDGRLVTSVEGPGIQTVQPLTVTITTPRLDFVGAGGASRVDVAAKGAKELTVRAGGASTVRVKGIDSDAVALGASGASRVEASGRGKRLDLEVSGASTVKAADVPFESAKVDVSGASNAEVHVAESVQGGVSGASHLKALGGPKTRSVSTSGASQVQYPVE